jgi:hypothetical protein
MKFKRCGQEFKSEALDLFFKLQFIIKNKYNFTV